MRCHELRCDFVGCDKRSAGTPSHCVGGRPALSSSEPADQISAIVTLLENPDHRPAGPHEAIYLEILAAAKDITLDFSTVEGRPEGIEESLAKLTGLADKLPGTVKETVVEGGQGGGAAEQD